MVASSLAMSTQNRCAACKEAQTAAGAVAEHQVAAALLYAGRCHARRCALTLLMVGCTQPVWMARMVAIASMPPAAGRRQGQAGQGGQQGCISFARAGAWGEAFQRCNRKGRHSTAPTCSQAVPKCPVTQQAAGIRGRQTAAQHSTLHTAQRSPPTCSQAVPDHALGAVHLDVGQVAKHLQRGQGPGGRGQGGENRSPM